jgi:serine/threonine protein kinase
MSKSEASELLPGCRQYTKNPFILAEPAYEIQSWCGRGYNCARPMALTSGAKLGPYEIQSPLGAGGMGEVYQAKDTGTIQHVNAGIPAHKLIMTASSASRNRPQRSRPTQ